MIAALYVATGGCYYGLPDVDPWDRTRDARAYAGPWPVVAHPPCARWCRLAGLVEKRWGHKRGDDGGCFAAAISAVRKWGGVLEHPAYSDAWPAFDLPPPPKTCWQRAFCGGWVCHVEQVHYGHRARKPTWLYAHGTDLPALRWGTGTAWCSPGASPKVANYKPHDYMGKRERSATPLPFRDLLISIARTAEQSCEQKGMDIHG